MRFFSALLVGALVGCGAPDASRLDRSAQEIKLPIGAIYDQGNTMWCWAYSSYHTLRTFYYNSVSLDPQVGQWRRNLEAIDSGSKFIKYLHEVFGSTNGDNPDHFFRDTRTKWGLEDDHAPWTDFYPTGYRSVREPLAGFPTVRKSKTEILKIVADNLKRGVPSVYCNPPHCMMIFGAVWNDSGSVQDWWIGDSSPSATYKKSYAKVYGDLDMIVTLPVGG